MLLTQAVQLVILSEHFEQGSVHTRKSQVPSPTSEAPFLHK